MLVQWQPHHFGKPPIEINPAWLSWCSLPGKSEGHEFVMHHAGIRFLNMCPGFTRVLSSSGMFTVAGSSCKDALLERPPCKRVAVQMIKDASDLMNSHLHSRGKKGVKSQFNLTESSRSVDLFS